MTVRLYAAPYRRRILASDKINTPTIFFVAYSPELPRFYVAAPTVEELDYLLHEDPRLAGRDWTFEADKNK